MSVPGGSVGTAFIEILPNTDKFVASLVAQMKVAGAAADSAANEALRSSANWSVLGSQIQDAGHNAALSAGGYKILGEGVSSAGDDAAQSLPSWAAQATLIGQSGDQAKGAAVDYTAMGAALDSTTEEVNKLTAAMAANGLLRGGGITGGPPGKGIATDIGSAFRETTNIVAGLGSALLLITPTVNAIIAGLVGVVSLLGSALVAGTALAVAMGAVAVGMGLAALKWRDLLATTTDGVDHMRASIGAIEAELFNGAKRVMAVFSQGGGNNPWEEFAKLTITAIRAVEPYILKVAGWVNSFLDGLKNSGAATSPWVTFLRTWIDEWKVLGDIINQGTVGAGGILGFLNKYEAPAKAFVEGIAKVINGIKLMSEAGLGLNMDALAEFISNVFDALANLVQFFPRFSNALVTVALELSRFLKELLPIIDGAIKVGTAILQNIVAPLITGLLKALELVMKVPFIKWLVELAGGLLLVALAVSKLTTLRLGAILTGQWIPAIIGFAASLGRLGVMQTLLNTFPQLTTFVLSLGQAFMALGAEILGVEAVAAPGLLTFAVGFAAVLGPIAVGIAGIVIALGAWHNTQDQIAASNQAFIDQMAAGTLTIQQATAAIAQNTIAKQNNASIASQAGQDISGLFSGAKSSILKAIEIPAEIVGGDAFAHQIDQMAEAQQAAEAWAAATEQVSGSLQALADNVSQGLVSTGALTDAQVAVALKLKESGTSQEQFNSILGTADTLYNNDQISVGQYAKVLDQLGVSVNSVGTHVDLMALKVQAAGNDIAQAVLQVQDVTSVTSTGLQQFAAASGQSWTAMQQAADAAINDPTGGILGTGQKMTDFLQAQMDTITQWKETYASSINFVNAAWGTLGTTVNLTASKIVDTLNKAVDEAAKMKDNISTVIKQGLSPAAMTQITTQPVAAQASIFSALATATKKQIHQINVDVRHGADLATATANVVGDAIGLTFDKVLSAIELLVSHDLGIPVNQVRQRVDGLVGDVNKHVQGIKDKTVKITFKQVFEQDKNAKGQRENIASQAASYKPPPVPVPDLGKVKAAYSRVGEAAGQGLKQGLDSSRGAVQASANKMGDQAVQATAKSIGAASPATKFIQIGRDAVDGLIKGVSSATGTLTAQMTRAGQAMATGLHNGLIGGLQGISAEAVNTVQGLVNAVNQVLRTASPSKVFYDIGQNVAEGLRLGIGDGMKKVHADMVKHAKGLGEEFKPPKIGAAMGGLPGGQAAQARQSARQLARRTAQFATGKEGVGVVRRVAQTGLDQKFIKEAVAKVSLELGKDAASKYKAALEQLDQRTKDDSKRRDAAITAAMRELKRSAGLGVKMIPKVSGHLHPHAVTHAPVMGGGAMQQHQGHRSRNEMRIRDWRTGLATLESELGWEDAVRTR